MVARFWYNVVELDVMSFFLIKISAMSQWCDLSGVFLMVSCGSLK